MTYHFIITLHFARGDFSRDGVITPPPGATRSGLYTQITQDAAAAAHEEGLNGGYATTFFSVEPQTLTA
jgi:hypothetical protein